MLPPDHHARPRHEYPVPEVNQPNHKGRPMPSQDRQPLTLEINMLDFILENLIAKSPGSALTSSPPAPRCNKFWR